MRITRPRADATQADLRRYLRNLGAALEELGIDHGESFEVSAPRRKEAKADLYRLDAPDQDAVGATAASPASIDAAIGNLPRSGSQRMRVLEAAFEAGDRGITSDEASTLLDIPLQSAKPRFVELRTNGWLRLTGQTRRSKAGSRVEVHAITDSAKERLGYLVESPQMRERRDHNPGRPKPLFTNTPA